MRSNVYKPLVLSLATGEIYEALTSNSKLPLLLLGLHVISDCSKTFFWVVQSYSYSPAKKCQFIHGRRHTEFGKDGYKFLRKLFKDEVLTED